MSVTTVTLPPNLFSKGEQEQVKELLQKFSQQQLQWLAGYLTGLQHSNQQLLQLINRIPQPKESISPEPIPNQDTITVLFGSKSGNSKKIAKQLHDKLIARGFTTVLQDMNSYQPNRLKDEKYLLVIVSTHGEGDPPPAAEDLHSFINSRKAPKIPDTKFAVLALGDKSYASYCQTGRDFDQRLEALQGNRILDRVDADVDFEETAEVWIEGIISKLQDTLNSNGDQRTASSVNKNGQLVKTEIQHSVTYNRKNPFLATVLDKVQLNGRGSAKQTYHIELSLEESNLTYQPGDTLGIWVENEQHLIEGLISFKKWNPESVVTLKDQTLRFQEFLAKKAELTTVSGVFLDNYVSLVNDPALAHSLRTVLQDKPSLSSFVYGRDIWDILEQYPADLTEQAFAELVLPLQPRLYSIASSFSAHPDEVHLTIGKVQYSINKRERRGVASNYVADLLEPGKQVPVFIETNESFRLPEDGDKDVIMVGPGTGIAPFRAFVEERAENTSEGKNWLIFGDQHFTTDFLYQAEWQRFLKAGSLTRMNTAFSRDGKEKLYVQHRMRQHASELYDWIENGAHFYVCGDAKRMAKDVKQTLVNIVQEQGKKTEEEALAYVKQLIKVGRYQEDTY